MGWFFDNNKKRGVFDIKKKIHSFTVKAKQPEVEDGNKRKVNLEKKYSTL